MSNQYWNNFQNRYGKVLRAAEVLALNQTQTNRQFNKKEKNCIFDKCLDDLSLYRKEGKWITPYHAKLYNKRKNDSTACPVIEVSLQAFIQAQYNKKYAKLISEPMKKSTIKPKFNLMGL